MTGRISRMAWVVIVMIVLGAVIPIGSYVWVIERVPHVTPAEADAMVRSSETPAVLVDVRTPEEFAKRRIKGSVNWPMAELQALKGGERLPETLDGKRLLMLCNSGILGAVATERLRDLEFTDALNVHNGICDYNDIWGKPLLREEMGDVFEGTEPLPYRDSPWYEQWSLFLTGFLVKPAYMLLSFVLILVLRKSTAVDLVALKWAFIFFLAGEIACMVNYTIFTDQSHLSEFFHGYGMVVAFGFGIYALFEGADTRVVKFSDPEKNCAALSLCRACQKRTDIPCALKRLFLWVIPSVFVLTFMPLCLAPRMISYNTRILLSQYHFSHAAVYQIFETRFCAVFAMVLLVVAFWALWFRKDDAVAVSKLFFCAGAGALAFCYFRFVLVGLFHENLVWFNTWEELTEFIGVLGGAIALWVFRHGLLGEGGSKPASA